VSDVPDVASRNGGSHAASFGFLEADFGQKTTAKLLSDALYTIFLCYLLMLSSVVKSEVALVRPGICFEIFATVKISI
jgi:hypothetical protein